MINEFNILLIYGSLGFMIMTITVIFIFIKYYRRNLLAQQELFEVEQKFNEEVIINNIKTLEEERKRFAQDLHDEIGASLSAIRLYTNDLITKIEDPSLKDKATTVRDTIDESMASARRIAHNLIPPGLELMGLQIITEELASKISANSKLKIKVAFSDTTRLPFNSELMLYRVINELLNNTIKYALASNVSIEFAHTENNYTITYTDDGVGFDLKEENIKKGIGLQNIRSRVKIADGDAQFISEPGKGLLVRIQIPTP